MRNLIDLICGPAVNFNFVINATTLNKIVKHPNTISSAAKTDIKAETQNSRKYTSFVHRFKSSFRPYCRSCSNFLQNVMGPSQLKTNLKQIS